MKTSIKQILSNALKEEIFAFVEKDEGSFEEFLLLSLSNEGKYSARAAWVVSKFVNDNDDRIIKYLPRYIEALKTATDGQQRDLINTLRTSNNYDEYAGDFFDICTQIWLDVKKIPSVRVCALKLLLQVAEKYPELNHEIKLLAQENYLRTLSPGIERSIRKQLMNL